MSPYKMTLKHDRVFRVFLTDENRFHNNGQCYSTAGHAKAAMTHDKRYGYPRGEERKYEVIEYSLARVTP